MRRSQAAFIVVAFPVAVQASGPRSPLELEVLGTFEAQVARRRDWHLS